MYSQGRHGTDIDMRERWRPWKSTFWRTHSGQMRLQCKWECLTQLGMAYTELSIEYDNGVTICLNYVLVSGCSSLNATAETIAGVAELPYTQSQQQTDVNETHSPIASKGSSAISKWKTIQTFPVPKSVILYKKRDTVLIFLTLTLVASLSLIVCVVPVGMWTFMVEPGDDVDVLLGLL